MKPVYWSVFIKEGRYWLINLDFSSSYLFLLLMTRFCFSSVVSCQSHRKSFSELRAESGIFIAPDIGLLQRLWILLPFCPHVLPGALERNRFFVFSSTYSLFIFLFVCVCVMMFWITFSMSSEVGSPFQETQYSFSGKVPAVLCTLLPFPL